MAFHQIPSTFFARLGKFLPRTVRVQFELATYFSVHDYHGHGLGGVPRSRWRCASSGGQCLGGGVPRPSLYLHGLHGLHLLHHLHGLGGGGGGGVPPVVAVCLHWWRWWPVPRWRSPFRRPRPRWWRWRYKVFPPPRPSLVAVVVVASVVVVLVAVAVCHDLQCLGVPPPCFAHGLQWWPLVY